MIAFIAALVVATTGVSTAATPDPGEEVEDKMRLQPTYISTTGFRLNPLGLFEEVRLGLTKPLSRSDHPLF